MQHITNETAARTYINNIAQRAKHSGGTATDTIADVNSRLINVCADRFGTVTLTPADLSVAPLGFAADYRSAAAAVLTVWINTGDRPNIASQTSYGHLFFDAGFEYFEKGPNVFRAPCNNPLDAITAYRLGARFECARHAVPQLLRLLGIDAA